MYSMYISADLLENLFHRLPLKSLGRFKTVCKEWKSILESKSFVDMHLSLQKSGKIMISYNCPCYVWHRLSLISKSRFEADQELICLHCYATESSMIFEGLVCIPERECVNVLNPSTVQIWTFPSPPILNPRPNRRFPNETWTTYFPGYCAMGFGRDSVEGQYKVVRIFDDPDYSDILDVNTGEWKKLRKPPSYKVVGRKSACVNGTVYWLRIMRYGVRGCMILALDLHTEEFHDVHSPLLNDGIMHGAQIVNIGDRLAIAMPELSIIYGYLELVIWTLIAQDKEIWSKTHSIGLSLACLDINRPISFTPVTLSQEGNAVFYDSEKRLFKYYKRTDQLNLLCRDIRVVSPYVENLVPIRSKQVELRTRINCDCNRRTKDRIQSRFSNKGIVADVLLWRNQKETFVSFLFLNLLNYWFFFSGRSFTSSAAQLLFLCAVSLYGLSFVPPKILGFQVKRIPPWRFEISESVVRDLSRDIVLVWNQGIRCCKSLSRGGDWIEFFKIAGSLYLLKLFVSHSMASFLFTVISFSFTAFFIYEQYELELHHISKVFTECLTVLKETILKTLPLPDTSSKPIFL